MSSYCREANTNSRAYLQELIRLRDGSSHLNYAIYHDRYRRTVDGWKFTERRYEIRYVDTTPLAGSPCGAAIQRQSITRLTTATPRLAQEAP